MAKSENTPKPPKKGNVECSVQDGKVSLAVPSEGLEEFPQIVLGEDGKVRLQASGNLAAQAKALLALSKALSQAEVISRMSV